MIHPLTPIFTPRLVLRCLTPADASLMKEAMDSSLDHLRPWMPWAHDEPSPLPVLEERMAKFAADFHEGRNFCYGIFNRDESRLLGGTGLHPRNRADDMEIGYWLRVSAIGQGYVTESTAALTTIAFATWPLRTVTILCDPVNHASASVPARLGFASQGVFPARHPAPGRTHDLIWQTTRTAWAARQRQPHALKLADAN